MATPNIAQKSPYAVDVEADRDYYWCACGRSANQPFCDGSHRETAFTPVKYTAEEARKVFFCGCKRSSNAPVCDGSHNTL